MFAKVEVNVILSKIFRPSDYAQVNPFVEVLLFQVNLFVQAMPV